MSSNLLSDEVRTGYGNLHNGRQGCSLLYALSSGKVATDESEGLGAFKADNDQSAKAFATGYWRRRSRYLPVVDFSRARGECTSGRSSFPRLPTKICRSVSTSSASSMIPGSFVMLVSRSVGSSRTLREKRPQEGICTIISHTLRYSVCSSAFH